MKVRTQTTPHLTAASSAAAQKTRDNAAARVPSTLPIAVRDKGKIRLGGSFRLPSTGPKTA